jgi:putative membrane protein insertion efficiency factor
MSVLRLVNRALSACAIFLVRVYQCTISRFLPPVCRFTPSCSQYMIDAIRKKGVVLGALKGIWRIMRCNPFFPGGYDPVR